MRTTQSSSYTADPGLRARLQAFTPDEPGVVFPFSARLASERGWTHEHARRVVREYLRFVYLAATAGHPVTPSKAVDEAWHLHLTYTRSYWDELCGRVLGRPLHHEPTRGGLDEEGKFAGWYLRTLDSYRAAFGEEPPPNIWPRPGVKPRAAPAAKPRSPGFRMTRGGTAAALLTGGALAAGCLSAARADAFAAAAITVPGVMMGMAVLLGMWVISQVIPQLRVRGQGRRNNVRPPRHRRNNTGAVFVDAGGGPYVSGAGWNTDSGFMDTGGGAYDSGGGWNTDSGCDSNGGGSDTGGGAYDSGAGWNTDSGCDSNAGNSDGGSDGGCGDGGGSSCGSSCGGGGGGGE